MIVVTIRENSLEEARRRLESLDSRATAVEIRLDDLAGLEWEGLVAGSPRPVIATCRTGPQGGSFKGTADEQEAILRNALSAGARWVDIEKGPVSERLVAAVPAERLVVSVHEFETGTGRLQDHMRSLFALPGGVTVKLAFMAERCSDCLLGRELLLEAERGGRSMCLVPMGEAGIPGRILAPSWGSVWTYGFPEGGRPAAPGQLSLPALAELYDVDGIGPDTVLTGLLGWPIGASVSPWMHNQAARSAGLDARYLPFPEQDPADFFLNAAAWGLRGLGVTQPHKETIVPWLDDVSPAVRACGAANTITFDDGLSFGDNTDGMAALVAMKSCLEKEEGFRGKRLAILGAGGAAKALAWVAREHGAQVTLYSRDRERGEAAASRLGVAHRDLTALQTGDMEILANATPVGAWPDVEDCPVPEVAIGGVLVFDLIANPARTRLLKLARSKGIAIQGGIPMLVSQGEEQYRIWHGCPSPPGVFHTAAMEGLARPRP